MANITCIIAAYNEENRIEDVLRVVSQVSEVSEIIVVDDGSVDNTASVVARFNGIRLISLPENKGKSFAIATGIEHAVHDVILLVDADLFGLTVQNITDLLHPVLIGVADVSMSLRGNSLLIYRALNIDFITGDRALFKSILASHIEEIKTLPSYGLEVFINERIIVKKQTIRIVPFFNVISPRKRAKLGFWKGTLGDGRMIVQILSCIGFWGVLRQYYAIIRLTR